jgi:hypothetical protein
MQNYILLNKKTEKLSILTQEVDQLFKVENQSLHFIAGKIRDMPTLRSTKDIWSFVAFKKKKVNFDLFYFSKI